MVSTKRHTDWQEPAPKGPKPLKYFKLSDVEPEEVKWVWYPYIPAGKVTMLEGDPGQGKSWITCSIAADLSLGRPLPGQKSPYGPQRVLMLSAEDGLEDTIRPRIGALGGNMDNIAASDDFFTLDPDGLASMEELMRITAATIVFMDPIVAYMGNSVDMHRANEVRPLMTALADMAKRTGTAIVTVRHLRKAAPGKGGSGKAIYGGIGSIDFTAAVRSVLQVQETKRGKRFMYHAKHNLTPKGESLAYTIREGKFEWLGPLSDIEETDVKVSTTPLAVSKAEQFLFEILRDGPVMALDVMSKAGEHGISNSTLKRAKMGLVSSQKSQAGWVWYLREREGQDGLKALTMKKADVEVDKLLKSIAPRLTTGE